MFTATLTLQLVLFSFASIERSWLNYSMASCLLCRNRNSLTKRGFLLLNKVEVKLNHCKSFLLHRCTFFCIAVNDGSLALPHLSIILCDFTMFFWRCVICLVGELTKNQAGALSGRHRSYVFFLSTLWPLAHSKSCCLETLSGRESRVTISMSLYSHLGVQSVAF